MRNVLADLAGGKPRVSFIFTLALSAMLVSVQSAGAQVREQPVSFDSAGRIDVLTPPLAARLQLRAPAWPVTGDYLDARLYSLDNGTRSFVLVVRRPQGTIDRYSLDAGNRAQLSGAVAQGAALTQLRAGRDSAPTTVSEPVRGQFVASQTAFGLLLYGPAAAAITENPAAGSAAYLIVAGGTFFFVNNLTRNKPVSRAQNHLASHSALRGAIAANLAVFSLAGENADNRLIAATTLAGGVAGSVAGFILGKPMTDAEAHGTSYGSTVSALATTGILGAAGMLNDEGSGRAAAAVIIGAGTAGYPLGLRYVRRAPYEVTAGDVGTLVPAGLLGFGAAGFTIFNENVSPEVASAVLTAGYAAGLIAGERFFVRRFDYTVAESRLLPLGTLAGGLIGAAVPVAFQSKNDRVFVGAATVGGFLGMMLTHNQLAPRKAAARRGTDLLRPTTPIGKQPSVDLSFSPTGLLFAGLGHRGNHSILSAVF